MGRKLNWPPELVLVAAAAIAIALLVLAAYVDVAM